MKRYTTGLGIAMAAAVALTSCNSLKKMAKKYNTVTYSVTPNPLEMHGDTVKIAVSGKIPAKYYWKKATVTVNPVIKTANGDVALKPKTFVGPKVKNAPKDAQVITKEGGSFTYNDIVAYKPEMANATLEVKAKGTYKSKSKEFTDVKIAEGTIITPLLVRNDEKTVMGKDNMPKTQTISAEGDIHYVINQSSVRPTETSQEDVKALVKFIDASSDDIKEGKKVVGQKENYVLKGISITAAASPDGEMDKNSNLANERGEAAKKYLAEQAKKVNATLPEGSFNVQGIGEDWEGFKNLMNASSVPDKEMILRILSTYNDNNVREQEIKNISKAYTEISDQIFPKLRKAVVKISAEIPAKTDDVLKQIASSKPDSLTIEELLYAANLITDENQKLAVYEAAARLYSSDWRGHNNAGCIYFMQNKLDKAQAAFDAADKANANNPAIKNNLGAVAAAKGDRATAEKLYKEAGSSAEAQYNMGKLFILKGNYSTAVSNYNNAQSFNAALAKLLNGDKEGALKTLEGSKDAQTAAGYYLKAIIGARMSNQGMVTESLGKAFEKDPSLKDKAKADKEFAKYTIN